MNIGTFESTLKNNTGDLIDTISKSPVMIGLAVLIINLGGRFLVSDINRYDEMVLNNKIVKKLTIFSIAFLSTRDIKYSIVIVFLYSILFKPCGLAYKIMKKTQVLMNPFKLLQNLDNNVDIDTNSLQKDLPPMVNKVNIEKIKIY
jgi:hypothetical protein